jgi:hypothetical protein
MKFIEITPTVCVNRDAISWISQSEDGLGSTIMVGDKEYPSDIPYTTLVNIIQKSDSDSTMKKLDNYLSVATVTTL